VFWALVMVWCPFFRVLGSGGSRFRADGWAGAGAVVTRVVAEGIFNVPGEVLLADDFACVKLDAAEGQLGKAGRMDAARSWIVDERVALTVEDERGFPPSFRQGERGNRGRSRLGIRSHSLPRSILGT
jgi:hypothetical protein